MRMRWQNVHGILCSGMEGEIGINVGPWAGNARAEEKGNSAKQVE